MAVEINYAFRLIALPIGGSTAVPAKYCLVRGSADDYVISTAANRGTKRSSGLAIGPAPVGGSAIMQAFADAHTAVTDLEPGAASPIRVGADGKLERCTPAPGDDIVGFVEADGLAHLCFGVLPWNFFSGGGSSLTPGGSPGDIQINVGGTSLGGLAPGASGNVPTSNGAGAWTSSPLPAGLVPAGNNGDIQKKNGTALAAIAPGPDGDVMGVVGGAWASVTPASGAPSGALFLTLATHASLSAERVFTPGTGLSAVDGGANGNYTLNCTFTPSSNDTLTTKTINASNNTITDTSAANGDLFVFNGTRFVRFGGGSALNYLRRNAANNGVEWATFPTIPTIGGSNTQFQWNSSGSFAGSANFTYDGTGCVVGSSGYIMVGSGTQAAAGNGIRVGATASTPMVLRIGSVDTPIVAHDGSGIVFFGSNAAATVAATGVRVAATSTVYAGTTTSGYNLELTTTDTGIRFPVRGSGTAFTWKKASVAVSAGGSVSLTLSQSECPFLELTGTGGAGTFVLTPATDGKFYMVYNATGSAALFGESTDDSETITSGRIRMFIGHTSGGLFRNLAPEGDT